MKAIQTLLDDHKLINEMVGLLDASVKKAESPEGLPASVMSREIEFCRDFVNKWHEAKEEQVLIPELQKRGYPLDRGPIWETLEDHRKGRSILRRLLAIEKISKADEKQKSFVKLASAYSLYLYEHTREEEGGLFNAAVLAIKDERKDSLVNDYLALDKQLSVKGGKEKYEKIVEELKKELGD